MRYLSASYKKRSSLSNQKYARSFRIKRSRQGSNMNMFKVVAPVVAVLLLMGVAVATADAEQGSTGPILINVYTTDCTEVADIDGCYDVYLCADHPEYNERIVGIEVVEDCLLILEGVNPTEPVPNPSVPAVTPVPIVISFTG